MGNASTPAVTYKDVRKLHVVMNDTKRMDMAKGVKCLIYDNLDFSYSECLEVELVAQSSPFSEFHGHPIIIFVTVDVLDNGRL